MNARTKKKRVESAVSAEARSAKALALKIHDWAERPFREVQSANAIGEYLEANGFTVEFPFKKIPTAIRATWGSGKPSIGLLGEYDALPNCGPEETEWGHG